MKENYTINDFEIDGWYERRIEEEGELRMHPYGDKYWYLNYSSILTRLISMVGRFCENYASDLFILWESIKKKLDNGMMETESFLFGIRATGVDNAGMIINNFNGCGTRNYRAIYRLDFEVNGNKIKATLGRCS